LSFSAKTRNEKDARVYALRIARTPELKVAKDPPPHMNAMKTHQNCVRRKCRPGNSISSDWGKKSPDPSATSTNKIIISCMSRAVFYEVKNNDANRGTQVDVFCEDSAGLPTFETIETLLTRIFTTKDLSTACVVTSAAYIDQLYIVSGIKLDQTNWRRICLISILEADKVLRDKLVWNEDYQDLLSAIDIDLFELRKIERAFLRYIEFNLTLSQSEYTKYYFDLLSLRDVVSPLEEGKRTEEKTEENEEQQQKKESYLVQDLAKSEGVVKKV